MTAYPSQTQMTLDQLCTTLWDSQSQSDVIQSGIEPGTVATPLALWWTALDRCATWETFMYTIYVKWIREYQCHVLTLVPFVCLCFRLVRAWVGVGILCFVFYVLFLCVWPGMVPNQRQLAIIVSDWEPYLGSLCSHYDLWVVVFCCVSAPARTVSVVLFVTAVFIK